jgi:hypothetical protein
MQDLIAHVMTNHSVSAAMQYVNNKYQRAYPYNVIMRALKNTMLYGYYKGNPNYCPAYITKEMFDQLQVVINRNPRTSGREHIYFFTGLIKCPECGRRLTGGMTKKQRANGTKRYYYYRCGNHRINKQCSFNKVIFENTLERMMLERLDDILAGKHLEVLDMQKKSEKVAKHNLSELQAELDRLNYSWKKGRIKSVEEYDRDYEALMKLIDEANNEQEEMGAEPDYERIRQVLEGDWQGIYNELEPENRRAFWRSFVEEIIVTWTTDIKRIDDVLFF